MAGIFDIFSDQPAKDAAAAQTAGLNSGYNLASGNINQAISSLNSGYGAAGSALGTNYGQAIGAIGQNFGAGINSLNQNYGQATGALGTNYAAALQPYMQNYGQAQAGVGALGNALGLNGAAGTDAALTQLRSTPGYKFQQQSLDDSVNAAAAANGTLNSGNQLLALNKVNQGLADSTSNNYISQLQPFLGASNSAAGGIAGVNTGLGNALAGTYTGLGNATAGAYGSQGNSLAGLYSGLGNATANVNTGQGNAVAGQQDQLAQLGYSTQTGIGNANANADLAAYNASGNIWNAIGGLGGMKTAGGGSIGGNAVQGLGNAASGIGSSLMAMFSDERLKEDIEPVGELYDGTNVYRYRYIGDPMMRIGVMAQEVEKTNPDAVVEIGGYKAVDYGRATQFASQLQQFLEAA
jgi:hypothetical protein